MTSRETDRELDSVTGWIMRVGVIVSFLLISAGSVLFFVEGQTGYYPIGTVEQLSTIRNQAMTGLYPLVDGVVSGKPFAIIELGAVALLATPFIRMMASAYLFLQERRYQFVVISIAVLAILMISLLLVAPIFSS